MVLSLSPHLWGQMPDSLVCFSEPFLELSKGHFKCACDAPAIRVPLSLLQPEETLITPRGGG